MHMCTHLPKDPKIVLALDITENTYETYLKFPAEIHHDKDLIVNDGVIVVSVDSEATWGWWSKADFATQYDRPEGPMEQFTLCTAKK